MCLMTWQAFYWPGPAAAAATAAAAAWSSTPPPPHVLSAIDIRINDAEGVDATLETESPAAEGPTGHARRLSTRPSAAAPPVRGRPRPGASATTCALVP
jgi:hypothetical protein